MPTDINPKGSPAMDPEMAALLIRKQLGVNVAVGHWWAATTT
jgi:hypothetical protein